ncbi:MTH865 family protein [Natronomonas sp.]|uniref:MTH865 family protein n=1 Tax=Natronomonas sp. TaxID=2184060 RepID=UPI002FC38E58
MSRDDRPLPTQLQTAFDELQYPIEDEADFAVTFPSWSSTSFEAEGLSVRPSELYAMLPDDGFPYATAEDIVEDLLDELEYEA